MKRLFRNLLAANASVHREYDRMHDPFRFISFIAVLLIILLIVPIPFMFFGDVATKVGELTSYVLVLILGMSRILYFSLH